MERSCINCGTELPAEAAFCPKCGTKFEVPTCPVCGKPVSADAEFCIYCGAALHEPVADEPAEAETSSGAQGEPEPAPETTTPEEAPAEGQKTVPGPGGGPSKWLLEARHPNPLWPGFKFRYDVILGDKEVVEYDHREDDEIPDDARRYSYEDFCFAEVERTASAFYILFALALALFAAFSLVLMPPSRSGDVSTVFVVTVLLDLLLLFRAFQTRVRATKWTGENVYFVSTDKAKMERFCAELQRHIAEAQIGSPMVEAAFEQPGNDQPYFQEQFVRIRRGETGSFNWAAFFLGGVYFYYRKSGRAFWANFKWLYILPVLLLGGAMGLFGPATQIPDGFLAWLCGFVAVLATMGVYGLSCAVRAGRRFNREYYRRCLLAAAGPDAAERKGTSAGGAFLFLLCVALVVGLGSGGLASAVPTENMELWPQIDLGDGFSATPAPASPPAPAPSASSFLTDEPAASAPDVPATNKIDLDSTYVLQYEGMDQWWLDDGSHKYWRLIVRFSWTNRTDGNASPWQDIAFSATQRGEALELDEDHSEGLRTIAGPDATVHGAVAFAFNSMEDDITVRAANRQGDPAALERVAPISEMGASGQSFIEGTFRSAGQSAATGGATASAGAKDYMDYIVDNWGYLSESEKQDICNANRTMDREIGSIVSVYIVESLNGPVTKNDVANMWWSEAGLRPTDALIFIDKSEGTNMSVYAGKQAPYSSGGIISELKLYEGTDTTIGERIAWAIDGITAGFGV